jgi:hypothetical protein
MCLCCHRTLQGLASLSLKQIMLFIRVWLFQNNNIV